MWFWCRAAVYLKTRLMKRAAPSEEYHIYKEKIRYIRVYTWRIPWIYQKYYVYRYDLVASRLKEYFVRRHWKSERRRSSRLRTIELNVEHLVSHFEWWRLPTSTWDAFAGCLLTEFTNIHYTGIWLREWSRSIVRIRFRRFCFWKAVFIARLFTETGIARDFVQQIYQACFFFDEFYLLRKGHCKKTENVFLVFKTVYD